MKLPLDLTSYELVALPHPLLKFRQLKTRASRSTIPVVVCIHKKGALYVCNFTFNYCLPDELKNLRLWVDAASQNAWDTGKR